MGARGRSTDTCEGQVRQEEHHVLEAEALEALSTQTVTEALRFARRAHKDVEGKEPLGSPTSK